MPGLVPGIHAVVSVPGAWMAGTSPAMTAEWSRIELPRAEAGIDARQPCSSVSRLILPLTPSKAPGTNSQ